jgi:antitoxin VapB
LRVYRETGFADEWQLHHQGGPAGYEAREFIATPASKQIVKIGQTYAWNPSITGCKSEDTILVGASANETLSEIKGWPMIQVMIENNLYSRPAVLEVR